MKKRISVVIPVFNEEGSITKLYCQLTKFFQSYGCQYEIIFVNDGSIDRSEALLQELAIKDPTVVVINFRKNFGQTAAFNAGFKEVTGSIVVTMDGDLQNSPDDIAILLERFDQGFDLVTGWRRQRKDALLMRTLPSIIANRIISRITGVKIHDHGCSLRVYRASLLKDIHLYGEMHRLIPALCATVGARISEVEVSHFARTEGVTKYSLSRIFRVILDLLTITMQLRFATRPLHLLGLPGLFSMATGSVICLHLTYLKLIMHQDIAGRPLLILGVLLIIVGLQFFSIGLLAELIIRMYHETTEKTTFHIRSAIRNSIETEL